MASKITVVKGIIPRRILAGQAMAGPDVLLLGCPKCGANSLLDIIKVNYILNDSVLNIMQDIACPYNCGLVFSVVENEVIEASEDDNG